MSSAKLANTSLVIHANPNWTDPFPITATVLEVQDNGEVVVYNVSGDGYVLFSYNHALVVLSEVALSSLEEALGNVQVKLRALRQTARRVSPDFLDNHMKAPKQSGFPGANDPADEKVA